MIVTKTLLKIFSVRELKYLQRMGHIRIACLCLTHQSHRARSPHFIKWWEYVTVITIILYAIGALAFFLLAILDRSANFGEDNVLIIMGIVLVVYMIIGVICTKYGLKSVEKSHIIICGVIHFLLFNAITGLILLLEASKIQDDYL